MQNIKWASELNRWISKEVQMSNKNMKNYSISLSIKEIQVKIPLRVPLTSVRLAITKKTSNNKCWQRYWWGQRTGLGRTLQTLLVTM
jgi:hypothetical protein